MGCVACSAITLPPIMPSDRYSRMFFEGTRMSLVKYSMLGQDGSTLALRSGLWFVCCMVDIQHLSAFHPHMDLILA